MNLSLVRCLSRGAFLLRSPRRLPSHTLRCSLHSSSPLPLRFNLEESGPTSWVKSVTSFFSRPQRRFKRLDLIKSGENMYILCAEFPEFSEFVRVLRLPDTYQTWLGITLMHAWLCLVRIKREGEDGKMARDFFFKTLFDDVERRTTGFRVPDKERDIGIVQKQVYGVLFAYDEALLAGDDCVLAAALWRNLFQMRPDTQAQELELMVAYMRKQLPYLDAQTAEQIFGDGIVKFLPLMGDKEDESYVNRRVKFALEPPSEAEMKAKKKAKRNS